MLSFTYKSLFDDLSDRCEGCLWVINAQYGLIYVSAELSRRLDLPELTAQSAPTLLFTSDSTTQLIASCERLAAERGAKGQLMLTVQGQNGSGYEVLSDVTPWRDERGELLGFYGVAKPAVMPSLAQRQAEQLELMARVGRIGSWQYEIATRRLVWDAMACELYGYPLEVAHDAEACFQAVCHPEDVEKISTIFTSAIEGDDSVDMDYRIIRARDGALRHIRTSSTIIYNPQGQASRIFGVIWDTTQERLNQTRLDKERQRLAAILEGTNVASWEWNVQTGQTRFDERWAEIVGYSLQELEPTNIETWLRLVHPDDGQRSGELLAQHFAGESDYYECEARMLHKDGTWRWVLDRGKVAQWDEQGQPLMMYGTHKEITTRKQVEQELIKANQANASLAQQAQAANQAKTEFLTQMSHELRTPLHGIMGTLELLAHTGLTTTQQSHLRILKQSSETLLEVLNSLLDLAKVESGKLELEAEHFALPELLDEVSALSRSLIGAKPIELIVSGAERLPELFYGDVTRLRQILVNLVGNAVKFTSRGQICLLVELLERNQRGLLLKFSVEDTGVGIPDSKLDEVFESFSQANSSTTRRYGGSGLGLSIVKRFVELMDGQVGVESSLGLGSRFWFTIELAPADVPLPHQASTRSSAQAKLERPKALANKRVLIFDDHELNQEIMLKMLQVLGMHGACAQDLSTGLRALSQGGFDAVLMDVQMPELDGIELTRAIREGAAGLEARQLPIIIVSADATPQSRVASFAAGADDFVSKPVALMTLSDSLTQRLYHTFDRRLPSSPRCFDAAFIREQLDHDEALISALLDSFVQDMHKQLESVSEAIDRKELAQLQQIAHKIQGAASHVGAKALAAQALSLYHASSVEDVIDRQLNLRLSLELELFERVLDTHRQAEQACHIVS